MLLSYESGRTKRVMLLCPYLSELRPEMPGIMSSFSCVDYGVCAQILCKVYVTFNRFELCLEFLHIYVLCRE